MPVPSSMAGTRMDPTKGHGARAKRKLRPGEEWMIVVKDKSSLCGLGDLRAHPGHAARRSGGYLHNETRGITRDGAALLHGIAWCGECAHKMAVCYKGGSQY